MPYTGFDRRGWGVGGAMISATGGTITTPGDGYRYHTFSYTGSTQNFVISAIGGVTVETIIVAGGAAGRSLYNGGQGGGMTYLSSDTFNVGTYTVTVGNGGARDSDGQAGGSSSFVKSGICNAIATGGGAGGSGSGGTTSYSGGGGGSVGNPPGVGSNGGYNAQFNRYAGGGGGGSNSVYGDGGAGGQNGGGRGGGYQFSSGSEGTNGTGGGGGGGADGFPSTTIGGGGGSGIVIVRYPLIYAV